MIRLHEVLAGAGGTLGGDAPLDTLFPHVVHDSRHVAEGDLFVALRGERLDGHEFIDDAVRAGAAAALVEDRWFAAHPSPGVPVVVVRDTLDALQRLAVYWRRQVSPRVIGITGSIGKSSTKEIVAAVAGMAHQVVKSVGSYNNEIGLPLTVLRIEPDTEVAVLEMGGAYRAGEIAELAAIARPEIGVVTNVTHSHLARMGSLDAIAATKVELVEALPESGLALLNADDRRVRAMAERARCRVQTYGLAEDAGLRATDVAGHGERGISFTLHRGSRTDRISLPLLGRHNVYMALAGIGVGIELGMDLTEILTGFESPGAQLRLILTPAHNGATILDDHYNANPASSNAALTLLEDLEATRRIAVLGDMLEMGDFEEDAHRIVGRRAADVVDALYTVGPRAWHIHDEFRGLRPDRPAEHFDTKAELVDALRGALRPGDLALVKGSRGVQMEDVIEELRAPAGGRG